MGGRSGTNSIWIERGFWYTQWRPPRAEGAPGWIYIIFFYFLGGGGRDGGLLWCWDIE